MHEESVMEYSLWVQALELFGKTGFPVDRVTLKFGHEDDIAQTILDEARTGGYGTIVISRRGSSEVKRFFGGGITDQLLRDAPVTRCGSWNDHGGNAPPYWLIHKRNNTGDPPPR